MIQRIIIFSIFITLCILTSYSYAARITGTIKYLGQVPNFRPMATSFDGACPGQVYPDILVVSPDKELANVLVYLKDGVPPDNYPVPQQPVVLNQVGCKYEPHVFAAMIGQKVIFTSADPTLHTVDFHSKANQAFGVEMPVGYRGGAKTFSKEEFMVPIMCSVHPWMLAFANILSHPFFFVSEPNGRYLINDVPPGTYVIEAWHEKLGQQSKTVTVNTADELVWVDFDFI